MLEVSVAHLGVERNTNTPIVVLLEKDGDRMIPIYIGHAERSTFEGSLPLKAPPPCLANPP